MAADSDGTLKAVVICEGDLHDPEFPRKLKSILGKLKSLLEQPKAKKLKVNKVEPWNSVRVTLSIPKEAAIKLRQLAAEGSHALRALGILSVQLEGDTVISLRLAGQEIVIRTDNITSQDAVGLGELTRILSQPQPPQQSASVIPNTIATSSSASSSYLSSASGLSSTNVNNINSNEPIAGPSSSLSGSSIVQEQSHPTNHIIQQNGPIFKSPNTVCPMDGKLPVHVPNNTTGSTADNCEYPFESMTQARVIQRRENTMSMATTVPIPGVSNTSGGSVQFVTPPPPPHHHPPPPPYPSTLNINTNNVKTQSSPQSVGGNVAMTSPLLVNLLQNEGNNGVNNNPGSNIVQAPQSALPPTVLNVKPNVTNLNSKDSHELIARTEDELIVNNCNKILLNKHAKQPIEGNFKHSTSKLVLQQNVLHAGSMPSATVTSAPPPISIPQSPGQMMLINSGGNNAGGTLHSSNSSSLSNVPSTINISNNNSNIKTRFIGPQTQQQQIQQQSPINIRHINSANFQMPVSSQSHHSNVQQYRYQLQHPQQQHPPHMQQFRHPSPAPVMPHNNNSSNSTFPPPLPPPSNNNSNTFTPRWPLKPMDSATKSSYQEFARYQMQYNLSQQQMQHNFNVRSNNSNINNNTGTGGSTDLFSLDSDLAELSKNDLDSLLPTLSASELDSELGLDGKTPLEALLLDPKDLDLDLIDQQPIIAPGTGGVGSGINPSTTNIVSNIATGGGKSVPNKQKQMLINPLTGELEPMPSEESSSEAEMDEINFQEFNSEFSNSLYSDDDNSCSTGFSKTTSDQSDTERSNMSDTSSFNKTTKGRKTKDRSKVVKRERNTQSKARDKSNASSKESRATNRKNSSERKMDKNKSKIIASSSLENSDKIKLRLKLEKSEPVNSAYKVDVSFVHSQSPKRALTSQSMSQLSSSSLSGSNILNSPNMSHLPSANPMPFTSPSSSISLGTSQQSTVQQSPAGEELRVPPLHIRLRGENSVVIKNSKKDRKKSSSMPSSNVLLTNQSNSSNNNGSNSGGNIGHPNFGGSVGTSLINAMGGGNTPNSDELNDNNINSKKLSTGINKISHHHSKVNNNHSELLNRKSVNSNSMDYFDESNASLLQNRPSLIIEKIQNKSDSNTSSFHGEKDGHDSMIKSISPSTSQQQQTILNSTTCRENPNGIINCPEKKRKLSNSLISLGSITTGSSATSMSNSTLSITNAAENNDDYIHIKGPIGSTNVGTIPQHSSLIQTKNQKGMGSNSLMFNNKINKTSIIKTGKPIIKNLIKPILLPQTNVDVINEEKFKQKLLENTSIASTSPTSVTSAASTATTCSTTNCNTPYSQSSQQQNQTQTQQSMANDNYNNNNKINNSTNYNKEINTDLSKKIEINHSSRPPEKPMHQQQQPNPNRCNNAPDQNNAIPVVQQRGSPNSQAQGEDSGIESMDALSEKSPNQLTQSPQDDNKHSPNNLNDNSSGNTKNTGKMMEDFSNIDLEAALADMEGIVPTQNLNGDHSTIVTSSNEQHTSSESIITKSNDTLLNELMMTPNNDEIENKDIKINFDDDECGNTKLELNLENNVTNKLGDIKDNTKQEHDTFSTSANNILSQTFNVTGDVKEVKDNKQMLQQLSIEIPSHEDQNLPRVRTRASSKLESPLDPSKQSPSIDSPASCLSKAGLKLSQAAIDRLSPKISKPGKRKRQESESSTQSCVSDDTPGRSKKMRKSMASSTSSTTTITSITSSSALSVSNVNSLEKSPHVHMQNKKTPSASSETQSTAKHTSNCSIKSQPINVTNTPTTSASTTSAAASTEPPQQLKKGEDSSDSDEPLSEMANNKSKKIPKPPGPTSISHNTAGAITVLPFSSDTDKISKGHKTALPSMTLPNITTTLVTPLITSTVTNSVGTATTPPAIVTSPTTPTIRNLSVKIQSCDDKISTRRSVRMTNINYAKGGQKQINAVVPNVASTGSSVPTSPNVIGAGGGGDLKTVSQPFLQTKPGAGSGNITSTLSSEQTTEARRKTRSAGLDASAEGRRRRGSRDGK